MLTDEQLAQRRKGITATDVAKIAGQSPYGCAEDVRLDKLGCGRPFVEHDRVKWGNLLEEPIRGDYAQRHGIFMDGGDRLGTLEHPTEPWAMATPDGIVYAEPRHNRPVSARPLWGHEIKTHISWLSHLYGDPGTDQVPPWELIQCVWNIWVASAFYGVQIERWDLTVFLDGLPTDYTIMRDEDLEAQLVEMARDFWQTHVIGGEPVPPDGSASFSKILSHRFPQHDPDKVMEATPEQFKTVLSLEAARRNRKIWKTEEDRIAQEIQLFMGDAESLTWPTGVAEKLQKINWKRSKDSEKVDHKGAIESIRNLLTRASLSDPSLCKVLEVVDELVEAHTTTKPGARPFTVPRNWSAK